MGSLNTGAFTTGTGSQRCAATLVLLKLDGLGCYPAIIDRKVGVNILFCMLMGDFKDLKLQELAKVCLHDTHVMTAECTL